MTEIRTHVRVGSDGNVTIPVGISEAGAVVEVVVSRSKPKVTDEEYRAIIARTSGSIPDIEAPPRWAWAEREPLD